MNDNTDLLHKPDAVQPPPRSFKPLIWIVIFILLLTVNVLFVSWAIWQMSGYMGAMAALAIFPLALPLAIIDFIAVFSYIRKHPNGIIAKVISYTVLIVLIIIIILAGIFVFQYYLT